MSKKRPDTQVQGEASLPHPQRAWELLQSTLRTFLDNPSQDTAALLQAFEDHVPEAQRTNVETVLASYLPGGAGKSYRIGLIVQLAFALTAEEGQPLDLTERPPGARGKPSGVAHKAHLLLSTAHIVSVEDAYQNIAKNTTNLARGNFPEFDDFLRWASEKGRTREDLQAVFVYCCRRIVSTARPVLPMPDLVQGALSFARVMSLFQEMLDTPSAGAHEQFITACLLHAKVEQTNVPGHRTERVETKRLTASDASSRAAADIQIQVGSRVLEAFEVTANPWTDKVAGARDKMRAHDLTRLHIVARVDSVREMLAFLMAQEEDISVLEIRAFVASLTAELTKAGRVSALKRLYELLDRYQTEIALVNAYVGLVRKHGLAVPATSEGGPATEHETSAETD
ncbi:MAG: hypothetical protein JO112_14110 [Planctomycetes bacterium]|nr:hypothetical protein [Planctomycetota bacterium]